MLVGEDWAAEVAEGWAAAAAREVEQRSAVTTAVGCAGLGEGREEAVEEERWEEVEILEGRSEELAGLGLEAEHEA